MLRPVAGQAGLTSGHGPPGVGVGMVVVVVVVVLLDVVTVDARVVVDKVVEAEVEEVTLVELDVGSELLDVVGSQDVVVGVSIMTVVTPESQGKMVVDVV